MVAPGQLPGQMMPQHQQQQRPVAGPVVVMQQPGQMMPHQQPHLASMGHPGHPGMIQRHIQQVGTMMNIIFGSLLIFRARHGIKILEWLYINA